MSHLDGATGDVDPYDPVVSGAGSLRPETGGSELVFGLCFVSVRVLRHVLRDDPRDGPGLVEPHQHFQAATAKAANAPSPTRTLRRTIDVFDPAVKAFSVRHLREDFVEIVDETSVGIQSVVRFDFNEADGRRRRAAPTARRRVLLPPRRPVVVYMRSADGLVEDVVPDSAGYFAFSFASASA